MDNIKHIIFDLGNVILNIDFNKTIESFKHIGVDDVEGKIMSKEAQEILKKYEVGEISTTHFIAYLKSKIKTPVTDQQIINAWNATLLDFPLRRLQILQQLQLHYDIVLLSNTNELHENQFNQILNQSHGIPNIAVFFDRVYYSHRVGLRKPSPDIFKLLLDECQFNPSNTLFLDDVKENILAADSLFINTIHLDVGMTIEDNIFKKLY